MSFKEVDMYPYLKDFLMKIGYDVKSELKTFDIVARRGEETIIIEMKKNLNLTLILQAMEAKNLSDNVYIAICRPKIFRSRRWRQSLSLLKKLNIGLLTVAMHSKSKHVEIVSEALVLDIKNNKRKKALIKEFDSRTADYNLAGINRTKLVTAYRENAIHIAYILLENESLCLKEIREITKIEDASKYLQNNHYKWFVRIARATYSLNDTGKEEINDFPEVLKFYEKLYEDLDLV